MNKTVAFIFLVTLIISGGSMQAQVSGFDQVGTTSFQFLQVIPSAEAAGIGAATTTTIRNSEAVFFNPAALTMAGDLDVSVSFLDYFLDVKISSMAASYNMGNFGVVSASILAVDLGPTEETRADFLFRDEASGQFNPGLTGNTIEGGSLAFGLSYAKSLTDKFAFGVTAKIAREDLVAKAITTPVFDGGLIYKTGYKSLMLGATLRNFGAEVSYYGKNYPLPQSLSLGFSGYLLGGQDAFIRQMANQSLLFAFDLSQTRDHSQQQHVGLEYQLGQYIALRGGYKINFDEEDLTFGFGLKFRQFRLDYAYNSFGEFLGNVQRFSTSFTLK